MMELADPGESVGSSIRSTFFIDLNEAPSSASSPHARLDSEIGQLPESYAITYSISDCSLLPMAVSSELCTLECSECKLPETREDVLVCDGCERGFHLFCAGFQDTKVPDGSVDWLCINCLNNSVLSKRWPLGVKKRRFLDINSSPPSDLDSDSTWLSDRAMGTDCFRDTATFKHQRIHMDNGHKTRSRHPTDSNNVGYESIFVSSSVVDSKWNDLKTSSFQWRNFNTDKAAVNDASQYLSEIFLENLKQFVSERRGFLEDGWKVEFKNENNSCNNSMTYYSPDGTSFGSLTEVATYLGLITCQVDGDAKREGSFCRSQRIKLPKRRKRTPDGNENGFSEIKVNTANRGCEGSLSNDQFLTENNQIGTNVADVEEDITAKQSLNALPVQFEDYYILSVGKIDCRPTYHDTDVVWPVGFKSMWHDKVTRSLFICEITEGGDFGPLFTVRRLPCSALSIPKRCSVLIAPNLSVDFTQKYGLLSRSLLDYVDNEVEENIESILSLQIPPTESDILSCLSRSAFESFESIDIGIGIEVTGSGDEIGEIYVEEKSSISAWKLIAQKFANAYTEWCNKGSTKLLFCDHMDKNFQLRVNRNGISDDILHPLLKFCSCPSLLGIPNVEQKGHEASSGALLKWLSVDRFGLDAEFVQEILEHFLDVDSCSKYRRLNKRCPVEAFTVANSRLIANCSNVNSVDLFNKKPKRSLLGGYMTPNQCHPSGRILSCKLPKNLVGDFYQVWEMLCRLQKVLGIEEPLPLEQLEEEIADFDCHGAKIFENSGKNVLSNIDCESRKRNQILETASSSSNPPFVYDFCRHTDEKYLVNDVADIRVPSVNYALVFGELSTKVHCTVLGVLISELQSKVATMVYPNFCSVDSKGRKGRKKEVDSSMLDFKSRLNLLPLNELTWPELARRYVLAYLSMDGAIESADVIARESSRVYNCLGGDGGELCGTLTRVAEMEADALLLAEATKQIFGSLSSGKNICMANDETYRSYVDCEKDRRGSLPEWAQLLEPVKRLPTNVGTRIRKCVQDALEKGPPEWARKRLEHSISKEVYKGNASGPTKKAVLAVLSAVLEGSPPKADTIENKIIIPVSDIIMKQCRSVLRRAAAVDEDKNFCTLLGRIVVASGDQTDEGLLGVPATVSRPLDFRTIDYRLAVGAYGGSHESFFEDVLELWSNVHSAFEDQPDILELVDKVFGKLKYLFETEVLPLALKCEEFIMLDFNSQDIMIEIKDLVDASNDVPKAPWDEGLCKVCGVDRDDNSVLLCDTCDAEYHTYCLNPPLARIPEGNWYCPTCNDGKMNLETLRNDEKIGQTSQNKSLSKLTCVYLEKLAHLANSMLEKEYWELNSAEKITLLKFLTDELLNSTLIRQHLEQCAETSADLQQKLRGLSCEWKILKCREELLSARSNDVDPVSAGSRDLSSCPVGIDAATVITEYNEIRTEKQENGGSLKKNNVSIIVSNNVVGKCNEAIDNHLVQIGSGVPDVLLSQSYELRENHVEQSVALEGIHKSDRELATIKDRLLRLQSLIRKNELQLQNLALRREFLGADSKGHLYWASVTPDNHPFIIVNCSLPFRQINGTDIELKNCCYGRNSYTSNDWNAYLSSQDDSSDNATTRSWEFFQNNAEVDELVCWLNDNDLKEKILKESILQWMSSTFQDHSNEINLQPREQTDNVSIILKNENYRKISTKARLFLEKRYGAFLETDACDVMNQKRKVTPTVKVKSYRCTCLEPVWPSRYHCHNCHRTFDEDAEFLEHNGGCDMDIPISGNTAIIAGIGKDCSNGVNAITNSKDKEVEDGLGASPFDFEVIRTKFTTQDSIKDSLNSIGLIGSNGNISLLSSLSPSVSEYTLMLVSSRNEINKHAEAKDTAEQEYIRVVNTRSEFSCNHFPQKLEFGSGDTKANILSGDRMKCSNHIISQSSLRPFAGKATEIVRLLKINLLDMEAALCEEGFKSSRARKEKRWVWRAYVKSAASLYQMIQATIILEEMIRSQFLRNEWWNWSSFSAAAKTSTVSSLALRIYSLDAAILYEKCSSDLDNSSTNIGLGEQFKVAKKCNRKRSDTEG